MLSCSLPPNHSDSHIWRQDLTPSNLGTAGLGTSSRMVSSHSEIPHRMHHLLHGVSQPLCLRKKNAHGI